MEHAGARVNGVAQSRLAAGRCFPHLLMVHDARSAHDDSSSRGTMPSVKRFIEHRLDKQVSSLGLGVFRVAYGCVLFLEVAQLFYFRHFFFDPIPYVSPDTTAMTFALSLWLVVIGCLTIGLFTRPAAIVNYAFTIMTLGRFRTFEYHHDYILIGVNFLLVFLPVGRRLSVD
jgi:uncharacterized membrane protein YphA (DoxX/SURF4 family)